MKRGFCRQGSVHQRAEILLSLIVLAGYCWLNTADAKEVYTWTDKYGVTHFSDLPPESGNSQLIQVEDVYSPGSAGAYPVEDTAVAGPPGDTDDPMTENPQTPAQQLRDQLAKDREKQKKEQAEIAALCLKNQKLVEQFEPARRVYYTDEKGEQARMDDEQRVGLVEEAKDFIAKNCK